LEWQASEFTKRTGFPCRVRVSPPELKVEPNLATALFRIFQEALTNVARHAAATEVTARLTLTRACGYVLEVRDNGRGITAAEVNAPRSLGLAGMRERLYPWGGTVDVVGVPGEGTRVTVRVPWTEESP
jgi:signal transduction histidine kinase